MTARKWLLVEGKVYKLARIFDNCIDALNHTRILNREHHAILIKSDEGEWATYWRSRDEVQCPAKHYRIAGPPTKGSSQLEECDLQNR